MPEVEGGETVPESLLTPDCLKLWCCIGCGSIGKSETCVGTCDYIKTEVIGVEEHADWLEALLAVSESIDRLTPIVREIAALAKDRHNDPAYRELQLRAREVLGSTVLPLADLPEIHRATVYLCRSCQQVEAPQPCLGVCVRRNGEFVRGQDHDAVVAAVADLRGRASRMSALVRQFAWTAHREGQWERNVSAFQERGALLLGSGATPARA